MENLENQGTIRTTLPFVDFQNGLGVSVEQSCTPEWVVLQSGETAYAASEAIYRHVDSP